MNEGHEDGFTLIEALVALALGVMVVAVVLSTVKTAALAASRSRAAVSDAEGFARAGTILAGDALHALRWTGDDGNLFFEGGPTVVTFAQTPRPAGRAKGLPRPPVALRYELRPEAGGTGLWRAEAVLQPDRGAGQFAEAVAIWHSGAAGEEFRYLDPAGQWLRNWTDAAALPRAFGLADPVQGQPPQLVAAFPDLIDADCATGAGPRCSLLAEAFR